MKIKVASRGHDMTCRVDCTGSSPKYWIIYDTVSRSFDVIHNRDIVEAGSGEFAHGGKFVPVGSDRTHESGRGQGTPVVLRSEDPIESETSVDEAVAICLGTMVAGDEGRSLDLKCEVSRGQLNEANRESRIDCTDRQGSNDF